METSQKSWHKSWRCLPGHKSSSSSERVSVEQKLCKGGTLAQRDLRIWTHCERKGRGVSHLASLVGFYQVERDKEPVWLRVGWIPAPYPSRKAEALELPPEESSVAPRATRPTLNQEEPLCHCSRGLSSLLLQLLSSADANGAGASWSLRLLSLTLGANSSLPIPSALRGQCLDGLTPLENSHPSFLKCWPAKAGPGKCAPAKGALN